MFWTRESTTGHLIPLITQPNTTLYVGYYGPTFQPGSPEAASWLQTLGGSLDTIVQQNEAFIKSHAIDPSFDPKKLHLHDQITNFVKEGLPAISWNHGKLLVVNGRVVMTGGGNYWDEYKGQERAIIDHQAIIKGDAAITAHRYTNYFFDFLNKHVKPDTRSFLRSCNLSVAKPNWSNAVAAPLASFNPSKSGQYPVLTVGRLGDWHGTMAKVPFPVQAVDAVRDIALNELWHISPKDQQGKSIAMMDFALRDDSDAVLMATLYNAVKSISGKPPVIVPDIREIFKVLQVNPVAWASRFTRNYVIESAENRVCISQQMLIDTLQIGDATFEKAIKGVHGRDNPKENSLGLNDHLEHIRKGDTPWDGAIWPYDLLIAIGWALARIDTKKGDGVYIVLTTNSPKATKPGWTDKTKVSEFKKRLAICMKGMAHAKLENPGLFLNMIDEKRVDEVIRNRLYVKRIFHNDGVHYCHSKIVMVDDKLLYVGSDNAYPCYNEEHGVWIDHGNTIQNWKRDYWDGLWDWCTEATD